MSITVTDYSYRQLITGDSPSATNSGQVLLIDENSVDASFFSSVQNGGGDIRVCENSDGTNQLPVDVVYCDTVGSTLVLWTRKPSYTSSDRDIYIFCGTSTTDTQPAVTTTYGRNSVYTGDLNVYQFDDNSGDSSTGNNDLGTASTADISGIYGTAQDFNSDVYDGGSSLFDTANKYISVWINPDNVNDNEYISTFKQGSTGNYSAIIKGFQNGYFNIFDGGYPTGSANDTRIAATAGQWQKITFTTNGSTLKGFKNGVQVFSVSASLRDVDAASRSLRIGSSTGTDYFNGGMQLYKYGSQYRTASQEEIEYDNQSNPAAFWVKSTPDDPSGGGGGSTISPSSIVTAEVFGIPTLSTGAVFLGVTSIASEEAFGTPTLTSGATSVQPSSIGTEEAFGTPNIDVGSVLLEPISIVSEESFGTPDVVTGLTAITPVGIISAEAFGTCLVQNLLAVIEPSGIPTDELFGNPVILGGDRIVIPISSRVTWNKVAAYLRGLTFVGSDNDVIIKWLRSEGYEGHYNDSFNSYLEITECYRGTLTDKYAQWRRGDTPTGCWILEGGIWNDNGSWIDTEFWED